MDLPPHGSVRFNLISKIYPTSREEKKCRKCEAVADNNSSGKTKDEEEPNPDISFK